MLSVLISGTVRSAPETKTSAAGKPYTRFRVAVPLEGADPILASVVAFGDAATSAAALTAGDSCSIAGSAKPTTWTGKDGETKVGLGHHRHRDPDRVPGQQTAQGFADRRRHTWQVTGPDNR